MQSLSRTTRLLVALVVSLGLASAACGDDDDTVETDPAQNEEEMTEGEMDEEMDDMTEDEG